MLKKNTLRSKNPLQSRSEVWLRNIVVSVMLAFYLVFYIIPIFIALDGSFHIWNPLNGKYVFNGLKNYQRLLKNDLFWTSGLNTVIFCLGVTVGRAALGFACAYAIYSKLVTKKNFFRGVLYMPVISPMVGVAFVWKFMYNPQFGLINKILGTNINWLMNADTALGAVMAMTIWKDFGYAVVLYMAALLALDSSVLEAADIDGCSGWDRLRTIIIPLISPTTFFIVVSSLISYLQAYVQVLVLTEGGPGTTTYLTSYIIYNEAFVKYNFGSASAMSFVLFIFIAVLTAISFKLTSTEGGN